VSEKRSTLPWLTRLSPHEEKSFLMQPKLQASRRCGLRLLAITYQCRHTSHTKTPSRRILKCPACSQPFRRLALPLKFPVTGDLPSKHRQAVSFPTLTLDLLIVQIQPLRAARFKRGSSLQTATRFPHPALECQTVRLRQRQCPDRRESRIRNIDCQGRLLSIPSLMLSLLMMSLLMARLTISSTSSKT
jgi:hypothetical protein